MLWIALDDLAVPDVAAEEDLHGRCEWDGEEGTEEAAEEEGPEEHGENDAHRVESDGVADDLWRGEEGVNLLDDDEDDDNTEGELKLGEAVGNVFLEVGDDAGRDEADDVSKVGDDA